MDEQYLRDLYTQVLGREPDPAGFAHNLGLLQSGAISASDLANAFTSSQEAQQNNIPAAQEQQAAQGLLSGSTEQSTPSPSSQISQLYQNLLGRAPDAGAQGWIDSLAAGNSIENIARDIGASQEARNKAISGLSSSYVSNDPYNLIGKVTQLYASSIGRIPSASQIEADVNLLRNNPDDFQWLAQNVTNSQEAQAYAQKTGTNLENAYTGAIQNYGLWKPSPEQGGIGGFFNRYGEYLPYAALAAMTAGAASGLAAGAGAAGAGAGAAGAGAGTAGLTTAEILASTGFIPTAGSSFAIVPGAAYTAAGLGAVGQALPYTTAFDAANLYGQGLSQAAIEQNLAMTGIDKFLAADAAGLASQGLSDAAIAQNLSYGYSPAELAGTGIESMALSSGGTGIDNLLSSLGSALKTPLGQLGVKGGLGLLSGGAQQAAVPQMAGGSGTYAPKGQVDYTPILNLLAPRQIARNTNSLLG
jgi:hypothetical protein